jgi:heme exporter protein A
MPPSLRFEDVRRDFGRLQVLRGVSATVERGQVLLVHGANGSGKSTLLRCLAGLLKPRAGRIELREDDAVLDAEGRRRRAGYAAPDLALYDELSASENLRLFARLRGVAPERGDELLDTLGVPGGRGFGLLSSGMRQRVRLAFALLHRPRLLLLDEPFQNLDRDAEAAVRALLQRHLADGLAVIASPSPSDLDLPGHALVHLALSR